MPWRRLRPANFPGSPADEIREELLTAHQTAAALRHRERELLCTLEELRASGANRRPPPSASPVSATQRTRGRSTPRPRSRTRAPSTARRSSASRPSTAHRASSLPSATSPSPAPRSGPRTTRPPATTPAPEPIGSTARSKGSDNRCARSRASSTPSGGRGKIGSPTPAPSAPSFSPPRLSPSRLRLDPPSARTISSSIAATEASETGHAPRRGPTVCPRSPVRNGTPIRVDGLDECDELFGIVRVSLREIGSIGRPPSRPMRTCGSVFTDHPATCTPCGRHARVSRPGAAR